MTTLGSEISTDTNVFGRGGLIFKSKTHCESKDFGMKTLLNTPIKFVSRTDLKPGEVKHGENGGFEASF